MKTDDDTVLNDFAKLDKRIVKRIEEKEILHLNKTINMLNILKKLDFC